MKMKITCKQLYLIISIVIIIFSLLIIYSCYFFKGNQNFVNDKTTNFQGKKNLVSVREDLIMINSKTIYDMAPNYEESTDILDFKCKIEGIDCILQNPELPTGCEVTSLTMALNYLGYDVNKCTMASEYLPYSNDFDIIDQKLYGPDINIEFAGDPFTSNGYGCYPEVIIKTANNYLSKNTSSEENEIVNISGSSTKKIYEYVNKGIPVIVWATMYMDEPNQNESWYTREGKLIEWTAKEHCLLLIGCDNDQVIVNDPLVGTTNYPRHLFEKRYNQMGSLAIIIKKKSILLFDFDQLLSQK